MFLVIDTNVLFAFFRKGSKVEKLMRDLRRRGLVLLSPQFMFSELEKIKPEISKYSGITVSELDKMFKLLKLVVKEVFEFEYEQFMDEAKKISPDAKDTTLFAVFLKFDKCHIWSREPRLKRQKAVKVLDDKGVEELLNKLG